MSRRSGYQRVPNCLFDDPRLTFRHIGLLVYLNSHDKKWTVRAKDVQKQFRISEDTWRRLTRDLKDWGYLCTEYARHKGKRSGLKVKTNLTPNITGLENNTNPVKPRVGSDWVYKNNQLVRRRSTRNEEDDGEVIEPLGESERRNG